MVLSFDMLLARPHAHTHTPICLPIICVPACVSVYMYQHTQHTSGLHMCVAHTSIICM